MKDICTCFERCNDNYVCEKMGAETDFDYGMPCSSLLNGRIARRQFRIKKYFV